MRVGFTPIRVVCANTLACAHNSEVSSLIRVKHSKNVCHNLEQIRECMNAANAAFEATAEQYRLLASKNINQQDLEKYVRIVLGLKEEGELKTRAQNTLEDVIGRFEVPIYGEGVLATQRTYWNAYNAVNEYLNYERGRSSDTRMKSLWFGNSANLNGKALDQAVKMAQAS